MKHLTILTLLCTVFASSFSQKCKYDYDEKDPFTGSHKIGITSTISKSWKIGFNKDGENYSVGLLLLFPGVMEEMVVENDTLLIAIEGSKPLCFHAIGNAKPTSDVVGTGAYSQIRTYYQIMYAASKEQFEQLSENIPVATRIYFGNKFYSVEIKKKDAQKMAKAAGCIIQ